MKIFITIVKSPNVKRMIGIEISLRIGFMKKFIKPKINPIVSKVIKLSSARVNPETIFAAIKIAIEFVRI